MTPKSVLSVGRPAEYRRREVFTSPGEEVYTLPEKLVDYDEETPEEDLGGGFK